MKENSEQISFNANLLLKSSTEVKKCNIVSFNGEYGVVNNKGETILPVLYNRIKYHSKDKLLVATIGMSSDNRSDEIFDEKGVKVFGGKGHFIGQDFFDGYAAYTNRKWKMTLINTKGELLTEPKYDIVHFSSGFYRDLVVVELRQKEIYQSDKLQQIKNDIKKFFGKTFEKDARHETRWLAEDISDFLCEQETETLFKYDFIHSMWSSIHGLLNKKGEEVIAPRFAEINLYQKEENVMLVKMPLHPIQCRYKCCYVDTRTGEFIKEQKR